MDYKINVEEREVQAIRDEYTRSPQPYGCTPQVAQVLLDYINEQNLEFPQDRREALELYGYLLDNLAEIELRLSRM